MRWMAEDIDPPQFKSELEMKKLNVKKSRLVELNRGRFDAGMGMLTSVLACGGSMANTTCASSESPACKGGGVGTGPRAIAVDPYSRLVAAQAG